MKKSAILIFLVTIALLSFQNCGKVELQNSEASLMVNAKAGSGFICLPSGYTLESFYTSNLNIKVAGDQLKLDSDADGLSDEEEIEFGSDPFNRRTSGKILDSICSSTDYKVNCSTNTPVCNTAENHFGLNECDILALNLNKSIQVGAGIDSDKDSIPDFLEIRINSFPSLNDAFSDLDFDLQNTLTEAEKQTSIRNTNNEIPLINQINMVKTRLTNVGCAGEYWKIDIKNLPTVPITKFSYMGSDSLLDLSRETNENTILYFLKAKPTSGSTASKIFSGVQKLKFDPQLLQAEIVFDQSLLFYTGDVEQ